MDLADLQLGSILLHDLSVVVLPELLGRVLADHPLEDLGAAGVLVNELWQEKSAQELPSTGEAVWGHTCHIVDAGVDDNPHAVGLIGVLCNIGLCVLSRHFFCILGV